MYVSSGAYRAWSFDLKRGKKRESRTIKRVSREWQFGTSSPSVRIRSLYQYAHDAKNFTAVNMLNITMSELKRGSVFVLLYQPWNSATIDQQLNWRCVRTATSIRTAIGLRYQGPAISHRRRASQQEAVTPKIWRRVKPSQRFVKMWSRTTYLEKNSYENVNMTKKTNCPENNLHIKSSILSELQRTQKRSCYRCSEWESICKVATPKNCRTWIHWNHRP